MELNIQLKPGKKVYFASDLHLGLYPLENSFKREKIFITWLDSIKPDVQVLFLLGDVFDFWYEYKKVVPRGFTRFLGKLCELSDSGVEIHFFTGNHDVWVFDFLPKEVGLTVHRKDISLKINQHIFRVGHGDLLAKNDWGYRLMKGVFENKVAQWFFSKIHPNIAMAFGQAWSKKSRYSKGLAEDFMGEDKEHQILFAREFLKTNTVDFFIFGHRHIAMDFKLSDSSKLINLGEWIQTNSYAEYNGDRLELKYYQKNGN